MKYRGIHVACSVIFLRGCPQERPPDRGAETPTGRRRQPGRAEGGGGGYLPSCRKAERRPPGQQCRSNAASTGDRGHHREQPRQLNVAGHGDRAAGTGSCCSSYPVPMEPETLSDVTAHSVKFFRTAEGTPGRKQSKSVLLGAAVEAQG